MTYDKKSFALGMVTAFSECVAGGCKRLALSPPMTPEEYEDIAPEARAIVEAHGLLWLRERNEELPEGERFEWLLIAARQETLDEYLRLRAQGHSPARSLEPFYGLLSYDLSRRISTGRDTWRELFRREG